MLQILFKSKSKLLLNCLRIVDLCLLGIAFGQNNFGRKLFNYKKKRNILVNSLKPLTLLKLGGSETARGVKMLCAAQKLSARIFSNFMTFPDFYSSKSWCNF